MVLSLARVGYDRIVGYLRGGIDAWERAGLPVTSGDIEDIEPSELHRLLSDGNRPVVVDVREPWEYAQARIPGSKLIPVGELNARVKELDTQQPVAVVCATGSRSQSAAAMLGRNGFSKVYNVVGGIYSWQFAGLPLERGR